MTGCDSSQRCPEKAETTRYNSARGRLKHTSPAPLFNRHCSSLLFHAMAYAPEQPVQLELSENSYVVLGLATCFLRLDGETTEIQVVEPVPSAYLETVLKGIATAYSVLWSTTLAEAMANPTVGLMVDQQPTPQPCEDFAERLEATARSYIHRPQATQLIPPGEPFTGINYSVEQKRVLNTKNKISKSDNVKQHKYTHQVL